MVRQAGIRGIPAPFARRRGQKKRLKAAGKKEVAVSVFGEALARCSSPAVRARGSKRSASQRKQPFFTFADVFAGVGGFRIGLERVGGQSVFSCERDKYAQKTYAKWFGDTPHGNIEDVSLAEIPDHDVLAAGFPCQPFSRWIEEKKRRKGERMSGAPESVLGEGSAGSDRP